MPETVPLSVAIAQVLRVELASRGVNAATFARRINVPKSTVWRQVYAKTSLGVNDLDALASGLGMDAAELVRRGCALRDAGRVYPLPGERQRPSGRLTRGGGSRATVDL